MQLSPQIANSITQYIHENFDKYMNEAVRMGKIDTFTAQSLAQNMKNASDSILNNLVNAYQYQAEIPYVAIRDAVFNYANNYMQSYMTSRQGGQNFMGGGMGGGGINITGSNIQPMFGNIPGGSGLANVSIGDPTIGQPVQKEVPKPADKPSSSGPLSIVKFSKHTDGDEFSKHEDNEATTYSTIYDSHPIVDVTTKYQIKRTVTKDDYNYFKCVCHIPETCVKYAINNFVRTNARLCGPGKWIADLDYKQFILEEIANLQGTQPIDLSMLDDNIAGEFSVDKRISGVIDSICNLKFSAVSKLTKIILEEFNNLLTQYLRVRESINAMIMIDDIDDLRTLASLRLPNNPIMHHHAYERAIFHCFRVVITGIITNETRNGAYTTGDILPHLLSSPRFVLRDNGMSERFMARDDEQFIKAITNSYTAFANNRNIVVTNFIPAGLGEAIAGRVIFTNTRHCNIIEYLMSDIWGTRAKTIVMRDLQTDTKLVVKTGATLDGELFVFEDTKFNDFYGLASK